MLNKILLLLILSTSSALASDQGRFTFLQEKQCAPFSGTLFDPTATARLLSTSKFMKEEYELKLGYELSLMKAKYDLEIEQLNISLDIQQKKCDNIISIKDKEIEGLNKIIAKKPGKNALAWGIVGGFVAGVASTIAITYAVNK